MKKRILSIIMSIITMFTASTPVAKDNNKLPEESSSISGVKDNVLEDNTEVDIPETDNKTTLTISAVGDCTLGRDDRGNYYNSLPYFLEQNNNDYSYFFNGVYDILNNDDLTIANLESVFTDYNVRADKKFTFKAPSDFVNILIDGSVEAVNVANNHTYDYLEKGYNDTIETLSNSPISYFGNGLYSIVIVNDKKIGLCGIKGWDKKLAFNDIDGAIKYFKENNTDIEIFSFHWGEERVYSQNKTQQEVAKYAIDSGADLVLGHHPHVLQGIEKYKDKYIIYSLGNFVFGGNKNPSDKDSMIVQIKFNYDGDTLINTDINIIPVSISSVKGYNDYQPTILTGDNKERVLKKVLKSSVNFNYENNN